MEVKITISDNDAAGRASIAVTGLSAPDQGQAPSGSQPVGSLLTPPPDVARAAAALGAMNAGPAPAFGNAMAPGAPPAFIAGTSDQIAISGQSGSMSTGPDNPAGAAPGSGAQAETFTAPARGGEDGD